MLAQIETAFAERRGVRGGRARPEERMRRFVADASHELRTPLTSIRGFAELYRQGAATEPAERRRLMRRIEDEAARMGLLVEDLLLLARLDQQRPLASTPVDLLATGRRRRRTTPARSSPTGRSRLERRRDRPAAGRARRRAAAAPGAANLVGNALAHTPPGTPVAVRVHRPPSTAGTAAPCSRSPTTGPGMTAARRRAGLRAVLPRRPARSRARRRHRPGPVDRRRARRRRTAGRRAGHRAGEGRTFPARARPRTS